jgi:hypothetical protein
MWNCLVKCVNSGLPQKGTEESKKFNEYEHQIVLHDGTKLLMDDILDISGEIFAMIE